MSNIENVVIEAAEHNTIILVFANSAYLPVLENWLRAVGRLGIQSYVIVAMDTECYDVLQRRNIHTILRECLQSHDDIWVHRIKVIHELLAAGVNVLHSDADAVWLMNPLEKYIYNQPYDMIFSQGTIWPHDVHERWSFVACCGFYFLRLSDSVLDFIAELEKRVLLDKDDQASLNRMLAELPIEWKIEHPYTMTYQDKKYQCSEELITGLGGGFHVAILPHAKFQRLNEASNEVYIKHILSEKNSEDILEVLKYNGCYFE